MKILKIAGQLLFGLFLVVLFAYLFSLFLIEKPIDWKTVRRMKPDRYEKALHGTWRNGLTRLGKELQPLPNNGRGSVAACSGKNWDILPNGPGEATMENSLSLDLSSEPVKIELSNPITKEHFIGIAEMNLAGTHLRFLLRRKSSGLPHPDSFDEEPTPLDIYQEFERVMPN